MTDLQEMALLSSLGQPGEAEACQGGVTLPPSLIPGFSFVVCSIFWSHDILDLSILKKVY